MKACTSADCLDRAACATHILHWTSPEGTEDYSRTCGAEAPYCDGWVPSMKSDDAPKKAVYSGEAS